MEAAHSVVHYVSTQKPIVIGPVYQKSQFMWS